MKITVEHEVPCDENLEDKCYYAGDFEGNSVCKYHKFRNQTHGPRRPTDYQKPKCTLFDCWLPGSYEKCDACKQAVSVKKGKLNEN